MSNKNVGRKMEISIKKYKYCKYLTPVPNTHSGVACVYGVSV